ncbi:polysaccharide deacetylase domain protein [Mycobacterium kansasii]|uniref:Polysaccharide deacetylase domain protein n=1 Tax=Mycobacterium kansasii TaxID=1768 RepID=A0A1V3XHM5_MYCKA|nr:polysaccharide deacetylase domain protein [Mycobacterium kansasii]
MSESRRGRQRPTHATTAQDVLGARVEIPQPTIGVRENCWCPTSLALNRRTGIRDLLLDLVIAAAGEDRVGHRVRMQRHQAIARNVTGFVPGEHPERTAVAAIAVAQHPEHLVQHGDPLRVGQVFHPFNRGRVDCAAVDCTVERSSAQSQHGQIDLACIGASDRQPKPVGPEGFVAANHARRQEYRRG